MDGVYAQRKLLQDHRITDYGFTTISKVFRVTVVRTCSFIQLKGQDSFSYSECNDAIITWRNKSYLRVLLINVLIEHRVNLESTGYTLEVPCRHVVAHHLHTQYRQHVTLGLAQ